MCIRDRYRISGVPICDHGRLIGIITNRDMNFEVDMDQLIDNVMTKENLVTACLLYTSRRCWSSPSRRGWP